MVSSKIVEENEMKSVSDKITLNLDNDTEVSVKGYIAPIEYTHYNFHVKWDALANLRVTVPEKHYPASIFCDFLPKHPISVGDVWEIEQAGVLELLKQLHPEPNLDMHLDAGDSCGLWACLRGYDNQLADIQFRIHAEFKLKDGWYTPSQFQGNLVVDRSKGNIRFFRMHVPKGLINFDVNWHTSEAGYNNNELAWYTDMGYCPQMELWTNNDGNTQNIEFVESITKEKALQNLILRFYRSEQINWVKLEEALEMAIAQQKPVHAISINGPLADESC